MLALIVVGVGMSITLPAQGQTAASARFDRFSRDQGFGALLIPDVLQDDVGFMWFATNDGVYRYDGASFMRYGSDAVDSLTLSHEFSLDLAQDGEGNIWVGTSDGWNDGLNRIDPVTGRVTRYLLEPDSLRDQVNDDVMVVDVGPDGHVWAGTQNHGLYRLDPSTKRIARFRHDPEDPSSLSHDRITDLAFSPDSTYLWVSTQSGLNRMHLSSGHIERYSLVPDARDDGAEARSGLANGDAIWGFEWDANGILWAATLYGVARFDPATKQVTRYLHDPDDPGSLTHNKVYDVTASADGATVWAGTAGGLSRIDVTSGRVQQFVHDPANPSSLSGEQVVSVFIDRAGSLWVGTLLSGLSRYDLENERFALWKHHPLDERSLDHDVVVSVHPNPDGTAWVGTKDGLNRVDMGSGRVERRLPKGSVEGYVVRIEVGPAGTVWVGAGDGLQHIATREGRVEQQSLSRTWDDSVGITGPKDLRVRDLLLSADSTTLWISTSHHGVFHLDVKTGVSKQYPHRLGELADSLDVPLDSGLIGSTATALYEDLQGAIWMLTEHALVSLDPSTGRVVRYLRGAEQTPMPDPPENRTASCHDTVDFARSPDGVFWIATDGNGLCRFDPASGQLHMFTKDNGLPDDILAGLLIDDSGRLWVSVKDRLVVVRPDIDSRSDSIAIVHEYSAEDGLQSGEFFTQAAGPDGAFYFGGSGGLNQFFPERLQSSAYAPGVVLTGIDVLDAPRAFDRAIHAIDTLQLSHNEDVFGFAFSALDYAAPKRLQYAYRLEGFDADWRRTDGMRPYASYTNVPPGTYTFRVRGTNRDGIWSSKQAVLRVVITAPWWATWWALLLWGLLGAGLVGGVLTAAHRYRMEQVKQREIEKQLALVRGHLREKNVLLREVYHRVKNNLQIIDSLLDFQARAASNVALRGSIQEIKSRVHAMGLMHNRLYRADDLAYIDAEEYLTDLLTFLFQLYGADGGAVRSEVEATGIILDVGTAVPVGLIVNELATNALKHAFSTSSTDPWVRVHLWESTCEDTAPVGTEAPGMHGEASGDRISVGVALAGSPTRICPGETGYVLVVEDNGVGLTDDYAERSRRSLGLELVEILTQQLGGQMTVMTSGAWGGTRIRVEFAATVGEVAGVSKATV